MVSSTCLLLLMAVAADGPAGIPAVKTRSAAVAAADSRATAATADPADRRDVLLLLDDGPLHLRLHVTLGGVSLAEARRQFVTGLVDRLDADRDGKLTRAEAQRSPLLKVKSRPGAAAFLEGLGAKTVVARRDVEKTVDAKGGELVAYRPDDTSSQNDLEVFKLLDKDGSGMLEPAELEGASELISAKDDDGDECVSFQEFFPPPPPPDPMLVAMGMATTPPPKPPPPDFVRGVEHPTIARGLINKYDKNRNRQLEAQELRWSDARFKTVDANGNGHLDAVELSNLGQGQPDLELTVDLRAAGTEGGVIQLADAGAGKRLDAADRLDYAKVGFEGAVISFSHRNTDPFAVAIETAMRRFNQLDMDANGYLDRDETAQNLRFQRELFDLTDADGDGKIFADEMKQYVSALNEPVAATCVMNVYDTGCGYFMALDANADGRVSVREMRRTSASLAQLDRDGKQGIAQKEPLRHFHVEFVRGVYQLFGPGQQPLAQTPAFQARKATGPIWFQRMDRNNDGDLTWNEFLGPREVFHQLDGDADSLLDPQEAAFAK